MKKTIFLSLLMMSFSGYLLAQDEEPGAKSRGHKKLESTEVSAKLGKLRIQNTSVKSLHNDLKGKGFEEQTAAENYFGVSETYDGADGKAITVEFVLQDYKKKGSKDAGAVGMVKVTSADNSETYPLSLVAIDGDFNNVLENKTDKKGGVEKAHSWYSCWWNRVKSQCGSGGSWSLINCPFASWTGYTVCVIASVGWCATKAMACCACDCSWTCKWAVGCCDR